jgi:sugar lactone lactonase YvrE
LKKTAYDGTVRIVTQLQNDAPQGTRLLPNGEIVVTNAWENALTRVYPNGSAEPFAIGIDGPNGLAVNENGDIYASSGAGRIYRIDPEENFFEVVLEMNGRNFDGITFSPDYEVLYFNEERGNIHSAPVNDDGSLGPATLLVDVRAQIDLSVVPMGMDILDGMTADICGNIYVTIMGGLVVRVTPTGEASVAVNLYENVPEGAQNVAPLIPALNFGSGFGGWKRTHLYVISFLHGIYEVDVGVMGKPEPHL